MESKNGQGDRELGIDARKFLVEKFRQIVALFIDERSMVSLRTLGHASLHASETAHGGFRNDEDWGGIPIVVMFGDDYQLPPTFGKGEFDILIPCNTSMKPCEIRIPSSARESSLYVLKPLSV